MPAGLGIHPFFAIGPHSRATFAAKEAWSMDADCLPDGQRRALTEPVGWNAQENTGIIGYYSDWSGQAEIFGDAGTLMLCAGPSLSHLVAYAPASSRFLCLEPVSHVANGFNLEAQGHSGTGARTLTPGETWSEWVEMTWCPH
jgi:aldose 1-epimerase